jgi:hypothetical protein
MISKAAYTRFELSEISIISKDKVLYPIFVTNSNVEVTFESTNILHHSSWNDGLAAFACTADSNLTFPAATGAGSLRAYVGDSLYGIGIGAPRGSDCGILCFMNGTFDGGANLQNRALSKI